MTARALARSTTFERAPVRRVDPLDCFRLRAWARAYLWSIGEYDLHTAADHLQRVAERDMLIDRIGQDAVQAIVAAAFRSFREGA